MEAALTVGDAVDEDDAPDSVDIADLNRKAREAGEIRVEEAREQALQDAVKPVLTIAPDQLVVQGSKQMSLFEGKAPATSLLKLKGVTVTIDGAFAKGEVIRFTGSARIVSEGAKDKLDKDTGMVVEAVAENSAVVLDLEIG